MIPPTYLRSQTTSYSNYKGHATYWTAIIGESVHEDIAWSHEDILPETLLIRGLLSFDETRADVFAELPEMLGAEADCGSEV